MSSSGPGSYKEPTDMAFGVSLFAGILLATLASFTILQGLAAVLKDDVFVRGVNYTFQFDVTTWGWIHMIIGVIGLAAGIGILRGQVWANSVGIGIAALSALSQFAFMPQYPLWSLTIIAMDVVVIWALTEQIRQA
jgi:hypothetical protein